MREFEIAFEGHHAVVVEAGGGLRTYSTEQRDVIDGYGRAELATAARGQLLVPWPNRIEDGSYEFGGQRHQLPLTEPELGNALHGLACWVAWQLREQEPHRVLLAHSLIPQPGYPFALELSVEYSLSASGLMVRLHATNTGQEPCPYGAGAHPYLWPGSRTVDEARLHVPAKIVFTTDARGIPTGTSPVDGTAFDFREARPIGEAQIDHCYTDLARDADGRWEVVLASPDGNGTMLWADEAFEYVLVFTGDTQSDVDRRSLGVEPMTCPPNAFRSGEGVVILEPGASHTATWGLTPA